MTSKVDTYRTVGILLILSVLRSFTNGQVSPQTLDFIVLIPFVAAAALAFYIPAKLKTNYTKKVVKQDVNGQLKSRIEYIFDSSKVIEDNQLLDSDLDS